MAKFGLTRPFGPGFKGYKLNLAGHVPFPNDKGGGSPDAGFFIQFGPKTAGLPPVRLDVNPGCLNPHGFAHLRSVINDAFQIDWHWVQLARVSRVDAAIDVEGSSPNDWAWDVATRRSRQVWLHQDRLRTLYIGSKTGDLIAIYDKARQLKLPSDIQRTRIEFRKKNTAASVQDLAVMGCPLASLRVFDPTKLKDITGPVRAAALVVGQMQGMRGVLTLFPAIMEPMIEEQLRASTPSWWNPLVIWKGWPSVLKASLPGLFGISAQSLALVESYSKFKTSDAAGSSAPAPPAG